MSAWRSVTLTAPLLAWALAREARAQNSDSFYFSDQAALSAGAMVAVPGDPGAVWYNPAGLGALHHNRVTANGSVFGVRVRPIEDALQVKLALPTTAWMSAGPTSSRHQRRYWRASP